MPMTQAVAAGAGSKRHVVFDHSVLSHIASTEGDWRENAYARVVRDHAEEVEVWVSPTHVVELMLLPNMDFRRRLADITLALCDGRRMMCDYGTLLAYEFLSYVEEACGHGSCNRSYLDSYAATEEHLFVGALGLLACGYVPEGEPIEKVVRAALHSRWLRAEAGRSARDWLQAARRAGSERLLSPYRGSASLEDRTNEDLVADIRAMESHVDPIEPAQLCAFDQQRELFIRAHVVHDVSEALGATFGRLAGDLMFTFDFVALSTNWRRAVNRLQCSTFPITHSPERQELWMLRQLTRSLWGLQKGGACAAMLAHQLLLGDYLARCPSVREDRTSNHRVKRDRAPGAGLTFGAHHASLAFRLAHIFVTQDQGLLRAASSLAMAVGEGCSQPCRVVSSAEQLQTALVL